MSTKNLKLKRILSVALSLCMILTYNTTTYAAEGVSGDAEKTYQYTPETCTGHEYTELHDTMEEPTCTQDGVGIYACGKCGYVDDFAGIDAIPALGHKEVVTTVDATCTEDGTKTTTCERCDYRDVEILQATGQHDFDTTERVEASAATCLKAKQIGYQCKNCSAFDPDSLVDDGDALEHDYSGDAVEVQAATCSAFAKKAKKCVNGCELTDPESSKWIEDEEGGYDDAKHNFEGADDVELEAATCTTAAVHGYKCVDCKTAVDEDSKHPVGEPVATAHDVEGVEVKSVAATCAHGSYDVQICKLCGGEVKTNVNDTLNPTNHEYAEELSVISEATCHAYGVKAYRCTNPECDAYDEEHKVVGTEYDANNHEWGEEKTLPADCLNNARVVKVCPHHETAEKKVKDLYDESVTAGTENKSLKAKGHTIQVLPAVPATCQNPGKTEGKKCLVCGEIITAQEEVEVNANAHKYAEEADEIFKEETCSKTGLGKYICQEDDCGHVEYKVIPARHIYEEIITKAATCEEAGEKVMTCNREGGCTNASDANYTKTEVIAALGHAWGNGVETEAATCTEEGVKTFTCANCGEERTTAIPVIAHNYVTKLIPATCEHVAQNGSACSVCGKVEPNTTPVDIEEGQENYAPKESHTYVEDEEQSTEVTCTEDGETVEVCSVCGDINKTTVASTGHEFDKDPENSSEDAITLVPPTCKEDGSYVKHCSKCNENIALEGEELDAYLEAISETEVPQKTNHEGSTEEREEIPPTCQEPGHAAGKYCTVCEEYFDGGDEIPEDTTNGHNWEITPLKAATCTVKGVGKYTCQNDGCTETKYEVIEPGHKWKTEGTVTTPATCTEDGVRTFKCENCDDTKTEAIEASGHTWGDWDTTTNAATCGKDGKKTRTCSVCSATDEKTLTATGDHKYEYRVLEADCVNPARVGSFCKVCNALEEGNDATVINDTTKPDIIDAYKTLVEYPDDEEDADNEQKAALKAFEDSLVEQAALDHNTTTTTTKQPTCTEAGETKTTCSRCGNKTTGTIAKKGHDFEDEYVAPTCEENGKVTPVCQRENCGYRGTTVDLGDLDPKTGHELVADNENALKKATCTTTGVGKKVCIHDDCDYSEYGVIPITHSYDDGDVEEEATCTTDGEKVYTCSICDADTEGHTKSEVIPATGHSYGVRKYIEATCTTPAKVGRECETCGELEAGAVVVTEENASALANAIVKAMELDDSKEEDRTTIAEIMLKVQPVEALGHDWERPESTAAPMDTTPATCDAAGEKLYVCGDCQTEGRVEIDQLQHQYKETYHPATCTTAGYMETTCTRDNCSYSNIDRDTFAEIDPAMGHDWENVAKVEATCVAVGHESGKQCKRCDAETGCEEIAIDKENGHDWDDGVEQGDDICTKGGVLLKTCSLCEATDDTEEIEPGHKWERQTILDPDTGKTAAIVKGCARAGCNEIDEYLYMPKGYGYCPTHELVKVPEEYVIDAVEATCTAVGYTEGRRCPECPEDADPILQPKEIPMIDHTFKEDKIIKAATCNEAGKKAKVCSACNGTYDEEVIDATGIHTYEDELIDATCNTNAVVKHICTGCGQEDPDNEAVEIEGTIDETAHIYDGTECTNCHKAMPTDYAHCEEHGWVKGVSVPGSDSTCTTAGQTEGIKCSVCKKWITEPEDKELLDHDYTKWVEVTAATCKEAGEEKLVCANCNDPSGETREIAKTDDHSYEPTTIDATCISPDKLIQVCTVCGAEGELLLEGDVDPDAHEFEDGVCKLCHKAATELEGFVECPTDGWVKGQLVRGKDATCKEEGLSNGIKCPTCKQWIEEQTTIDKVDHTFGEWVELTAATCKDPGSKIAKCLVCEEQYGDEEEIPVTEDHDYSVEGATDATCTANSYATFSCSVCGKEDESLRVEVPDSKLDHTFGEWVELTAPNCHEPGSKIAKCSECGEQYGDEEEVPSTGDHSYTVEGTIAATCTSNAITTYSCSGCGLEDENLRTEVPDSKLPHTFDEWVELTAPSCNEAGSKIAKCSECGEQYGDAEEIPATGEHSYTVEGTIAATCTSNAITTYSCAVCGEEDETLREEVDGTKLPHTFEDGVCANCGALDVKVVTTGTPAIIDGNYKAVMRADINVEDQDMTIVEMGVLYITSKTYGGNAKEDMFFTVDEADGTYAIANTAVKAQKYTLADANLADYDYVYININLGATEANHDRALYARGYVIVEKDGKYSVQFDDSVVEGTYADGFDAK